MGEENGNQVSVMPTGLADDQLLAVAAAAEKRVDAINRIKLLSLKVTNAHDWNDQGGKPYMGVSGAEKVARLFGISWRLDAPVREDHDDGHFDYSFKGFFSMGTAEIEVIGTRGSQDPFFGGSKDKPIPPSEIDRNDVKKGAMTNCIGNGISRLLGIRNLTWQELDQAGIKRETVGKVNYASSDPNAAMKLPNYGNFKGLQMDDPTVPVDELRYYLSGAEKSIADPAKAKYKTNNEKMRDALKAEIAKRETPKPSEEHAAAEDGGNIQDLNTNPSNATSNQDASLPPSHFMQEASRVTDLETLLTDATDVQALQSAWDTIVKSKQLTTAERTKLYQLYQRRTKAINV